MNAAAEAVGLLLVEALAMVGAVFMLAFLCGCSAEMRRRRGRKRKTARVCHLVDNAGKPQLTFEVIPGGKARQQGVSKPMLRRKRS